MLDINHNWSATKQHLHLQSVAEISHHSVVLGDRIRQCETSSGSHHQDLITDDYFELFSLYNAKDIINIVY